jgi:hypothetical protein
MVLRFGETVFSLLRYYGYASFPFGRDGGEVKESGRPWLAWLHPTRGSPNV